MVFNRVNKIFITIMTIVMLVTSGCSQIDISDAIKHLPQVKQYLENNPDFDLEVVHFSESEISSIQNEFKANCGKELTAKSIYRFVIDDKKSVSGVGYYDLNNQVLECFKKRTGTTLETEGKTVDTTKTINDAIVVDDVLIGSDGSVKVGNNIAVDSDGSVNVGGVQVKANNYVKVNEEIKVKDNGDIKVGNIKIGNGGVSIGDIKVSEDGNVNVGNIHVGNDGNVDVGDNIHVGNDGNVNVGDNIHVGNDGNVNVGDNIHVGNDGNVNVDTDDVNVQANAESNINVDNNGNIVVGNIHDSNDKNVNIDTDDVNVQANVNGDINTEDANVQANVNGNLKINTPWIYLEINK